MRAVARNAEFDLRASVVAGTIASVGDGRSVSVRLPRVRTARTATLAVAGAYAPVVGDAVLIAADASGALFVVGVTTSGAARAVSTIDGACAELVESATGESLRVRDARGQLVFEYDPVSHRSVVHVPSDGLDVRVDNGDLRFAAGGSVVFEAARDVRVEARRAVELHASAAAPDPGSTVRLDGHATQIVSERIDVAALRAEATVDDGHLVARSLRTTAETMLQLVGAIETRAERIVSRARNVFTEVEELAQTRASRVRLVAEATFHLLGRRTFLKAEKDMKIRGEKIYLA